jgi:hypothetical protein
MEALIPIALLASAGAGTAGTIISAKKKPDTTAADLAAKAALDEERRKKLESERKSKSLQRRTGQTGQGTILTGGEGQGEIGRAVLLGQ